MHIWGDEFDWHSLDQAIDSIDVFLRRWGRIGAYGKEKYGTARISCYFYSGSMHSLIFPGYIYSRFPKWLWSFDCLVFWKISSVLRLHVPINWWQGKVYNWAYERAVKKYPHIATEIVIAADYPEFIKHYKKYMYKYTACNLFRKMILI